MSMNRKHVGLDPVSLCSKSSLHSTYSWVDGSLRVYSLPVSASSRLLPK